MNLNLLMGPSKGVIDETPPPHGGGVIHLVMVSRYRL
jgi:hypothetical protein